MGDRTKPRRKNARQSKKRPSQSVLVQCGPYRVVSCANGTMRVEPAYSGFSVEPGASVLGVIDRLYLANYLERLLNRERNKRMRGRP